MRIGARLTDWDQEPSLRRFQPDQVRRVADPRPMRRALGLSAPATILGGAPLAGKNMALGEGRVNTARAPSLRRCSGVFVPALPGNLGEQGFKSSLQGRS